jgi:hypothetical protein
VHKHVFAAIFRGDEAEALGFVKPFYGSVGHFNFLESNKYDGSIARLEKIKHQGLPSKRTSEKEVLQPIIRSYAARVKYGA